MHRWVLVFTSILLVITAVTIIRGGRSCRSYWLAWCGLASTIIGDYFLSLKNAPLHSHDFLCGIAGFSIAQIFWIIFLRQHAKGSIRIAAALLFSFGILFAARVIPALGSTLLAGALTLYALLSIISVSYACGTHKLSPAWRYGVCFLLFSDSMIAFSCILNVPHIGQLIGITYLASLLFIAVAIATCGRKKKIFPRLRHLKHIPFFIFLGGVSSLILFLLAMQFYPGGTYNPCRCMLSRLGRTHLHGIAFPACHYLFTSSLVISAGITALFFPALSCFVKGPLQKQCLLWGGTLNSAGLLTIAFVPENVHGFFHNVGCIAAVVGGATALIVLTPQRYNPRVPGSVRWSWLVWCCTLVAIFESFLILHRFKILPFAPYVPTCQKFLILTFIAWIEYYAFLLFRRTRRQKHHPYSRRSEFLLQDIDHIDNLD
ncbi:MAG: hypothetical protein PF904_17530 [Kiritimatiellae bacterium]|jgi:hypothetical protein|nr:hypothetical protein [Kiritimatiellia bacterium]